MTEFAGNCQNVNFADPKTVILADLYSFNKNSIHAFSIRK